MTIGNKIQKYRLLHKMTQEQLGEEVGFKKNTADSCIRKYEKDLMAPKAEIREKIINALDVDASALSDIDIRNYEDIMHIFFELEETYGLKIEKKSGKIFLFFDEGNEEINKCLYFWEQQKSVLVPYPEQATDEQKEQYELWKSRFAKNMEEYIMQKMQKIDSKIAEPVPESSRLLFIKNVPTAALKEIQSIIECALIKSELFDEKNDNIENIFGCRLKKLRSEIMKKTQKEFAELIGLPQPTLSAYESGRNKPTVDVVMNIANKCNVTIDWLCGNDNVVSIGNFIADENIAKYKRFSDDLKAVKEELKNREDKTE